MNLKGREELAISPVVANSTMNRERELTGTNSYSKDLNVDVLELLASRARTAGHVSWLDLCCGTGRALIQAAQELDEGGLAGQFEILGVDLVSMFYPVPRRALQPKLLEANLEFWRPEQRFDLVTVCMACTTLGTSWGSFGARSPG